MGYYPEPHGKFLNLGAAGRATVAIVCQRCGVMRLARADTIVRQRPWARYLTFHLPQKGFHCRRCERPSEVMILLVDYVGPPLESGFWATEDRIAPETCRCSGRKIHWPDLTVVVEDAEHWGVYCAECLPADARDALAGRG